MAGICAFDEFAKYIGDTSWASYTFDKDGHSLRPDFKKIRTKIINYGSTGGKKTLLQDFDKMYPNKWTPAPGEVVAWSKCVDAISDTLQGARRVLTDSDTVMGSLLTDAKAYNEYAHQVRLQDRENDVQNYMKRWANQNTGTGKWLASVVRNARSFNIPFTNTKVADINEIDFEATLNAQKEENGVTSGIWTAAEKDELTTSLAMYKLKQVTELHDDVIVSAGKPVRRTTQDLLRRIFAGAELVAATKAF
ncbi:hypothetical protein E8E14_000703 [Neopestalotiopsis sp. 37M]|nr:hypothetical protein E8E14_000703 [Neopestalotiopsis sp. 37M]